MTRSALLTGMMFSFFVSFGHNVGIPFTGTRTATLIDNETATNQDKNQSIAFPGIETQVPSDPTGIPIVFELANAEIMFPVPSPEPGGAAMPLYTSNSKNITQHNSGSVFDITNPKFLNVKVFLEGPYNDRTGAMTTLLNAGSVIPLTQPYNVAPWNFAGSENATLIPAGVVDWILVELRDAATAADATPATKLAGWPRAFFLKSDGSIVDINGTSMPNIGFPTVLNNLFVVVHHRNHLSVLSASSPILTDDVYNYDFTTGLEQAYGGATGNKMAGSKAVMITGDIDHDCRVFVSDYIEWSAAMGKTNGYFMADLDLDRNVFVSDYHKWAANLGLTTSVSGGAFFTDIRDGFVYKKVTIGTQVWMAENLEYLPSVSPQFSKSTTDSYYYVFDYDGTSAEAAKATGNFSIYGALYNWKAAQTACPSGWHLPSDSEWTTLTNFLGNAPGGKLKEAGTAHWTSPNTSATNTSGFTALPGGYRDDNGFNNLGTNASFWSSTENGVSLSWNRDLSFDGNGVNKISNDKSYGLSVRCVLGQIASVATIYTSGITAIAETSASCGGTVSSDGGATVTARGVCWSTSSSPTTDNPKTTDGTGAGSFTSSISGLNAGTTYYVRAYSINSQGTSYGNEVSFKTNLKGLTLSTASITDITQATAISGGNIISDGGSAIIERGVCWATDTDGPTIDHRHTSNGSGTGLFTSNLTGLKVSTRYFVRAYATTSTGTSYGNPISFYTTTDLSIATAAISAITQTTATSGGSITNDGGASITARGICWSTSSNPTTANSKTVDGAGNGSFISNLTGLTGNETYYVRAYATNAAGTWYGNEVTFTTLPKVAVLTITTAVVSGITQSTATSGGNISSDGGAAITARGVCWAIDTDAPTTAHPSTTNGTGSGLFTSNLTGLKVNTRYFVRAYATTSAGTTYGNPISFNTTSTALSLTTAAISAITQTSASSGGNIISDGGASITSRGVCWSTSANPTIANSKTSDGSGIGSFTSNLTGLTGNATYYVRAYATNASGTAYGTEVTFTTLPKVGVFAITTAEVSGITLTTASCGGNITSDGGATVTARGVCWAIDTDAPTTGHPHTTNGTGSGLFTSSMTGLTGNTRYFVRAYATNSAGTFYGNAIIFRTVAGLSMTTSAISAITQTTATSGGNIISDGGATITARGICWSTSTNPTTSGSKTVDGTGIGSFTSNLTGLSANTTYYLRAYATNANSTGYGAEISFTTLPQAGVFSITTADISGISLTTASSGGNITSDGGSAVTARGVCWAIDTDAPTTAHPHTTNGTGSGLFTSSMTGLTGNTRYFVRAYATNSTGTFYGNAINFRTVVGLSMTTTAISAITQTTATSGGNIISDGGAGITARGVCWSTSTNPTTSGSKTVDGTGTGSFTSNLAGLSANTTYYLRAYATNSAGTGYGTEVTFTTLPKVGVLTITTADVSGITLTTATCGGNIASDGGAAVTARGVCWAIDTDAPTTSHPHTTNGTGSGLFTSSLTGLNGNTRYFVRAYATNSAGTFYGSAISFKTSVGVSIATTAISAITQTTATSGGSITSDGGASITARGVCWSNTTSNPTIDNSKTTDGTGTGSFTSSISGLTAGTTYYVRAYCSTSAGTSYGNLTSFITNPNTNVGLPVIITSDISNVTRTSAVGCGNMVSFGNSDLTGYGFCLSTSPNPTIANTTFGMNLTTFFVCYISGLTGNTTYYARAYATNNQGTSYGAEISFKTKSSDTEVSKNVLVTDGDSRTVGFNCTHVYPYGPLLKLNQQFDVYNTANGGLTTADLIAKANVDPHYTSSAPQNIVVIWAGINDIAHSRYYLPASIPYANLVAYCKMRKAKGWKVIVCTEISVGGTGPNGECELVRAELSNLIRANWRNFADGIADLGAHPSIGSYGAFNNKTFYCDEIHLTNAGTACVSEVISNAVNALIN